MALIEENLLNDVAFLGELRAAANGDLQTIRGVANLKEAIVRRISTTPGSLAHRPTYGAGLKAYQNAPNTLENQRTLALRIKEQLELDFRVKKVVGFKFTVEDNTPEQIRIFARIEIDGFGEQELDFVPFGETV